jgi:hypothetical protein
VRVPQSALLLALVALSAMASGDAAAFSLFAIREPLYALVDGVLLAGEAVAHWDRTGTLTIRSTLDDTLQCTGTFQYTSLKAGVAKITCNDGASADLAFSALGPLSGWGQGPTIRGIVNFTFGLSPEAATPYLNLPKGKRIVLTAQGPKLQDSRCSRVNVREHDKNSVPSSMSCYAQTQLDTAQGWR